MILIPLASSQHNLYDICLLLFIQYKTSDDGQRTGPKHVKFYSKNKLEKLVNLVGFTRVGTIIVATIYLQLIQNRNMFRSLTVLYCSHQHCVQPVASDVEVVGYL